MSLTNNDKTFYGKHIFLCENKRAPGERPSCGLVNDPILKYLKQKCRIFYKGNGRIRIQRSGCLDRCEEGPILVSYPDNNWFSLKSIEDADRFLEHFVGKDEIESIRDLIVPYPTGEDLEKSG